VKVLVSAFQCCPNWGSELATGWAWATTLAEYGHDVTVLTSSDYRDHITAAGPQGADFRYIDVPASPLRKVAPPLAVYDTYRRWQDDALAYIRPEAEKYDVIHHVTWGGLHLGSQLWQLPVPLIYGPAGGGQTAPARYWRYFGRDWPAEVARTATTGPLLGLNRRCAETVKHAAVTLVCNSATGDAVRRLGATDVRFMMADGLAPEWLGEPRASAPPGTPVVLWVGRMISRKSPVLAVEAFAELRRAMPARLLMAGDGPLRGQVEAAIDRLGIRDDVDLPGRVPNDQLMALYDAASALLFTSLRESFGAPFLEALGRGQPTVALDLHGIGDMEVGAAALKVALPPEPRDLAARVGAALHEILSDGAWSQRSAAGVSWAADWIWPAKIAAASEIYQEIAR
jgi:glycosyltransferase involved in cell wall biosynthesis